MAHSNIILVGIGETIRRARERLKLTQEETASRAGISRPKYREIEKGASAPKATTLVNVARAVGLEMMLIPQAMVPSVNAMLHTTDDEDRPAFTTDDDDGE